MILTTPAGTEIHVLDAVRGVSAHRYMLFNQQYHKQQHLGSDDNDLQSHLNRLNLFLSSGDLAASRNEFNNYLLTLHTIQHAENPNARALACVTASIDAEACEDLSEEGLERTAARLLATGLTQVQLEEAVAAVKKNYKQR